MEIICLFLPCATLLTVCSPPYAPHRSLTTLRTQCTPYLPLIPTEMPTTFTSPSPPPSTWCLNLHLISTPKTWALHPTLHRHPNALQAVQSIRCHQGPYEVCRDGPPYAEPIMPTLGCPNDELSGSGATGGRSSHRTDNPQRSLPPISASPCCQMSCGCRG